MNLHLEPENYKGIFHILVVLVVLFNVHVIDRKLALLEKKLTNK